MILGAFGDSFLHGSELSDCPDVYWPGKGMPPSKKTWPALCAHRLNFEYECYAMPGIGNLRILQNILEAIYKHKNNCFYIINWTWIERYDYFNNHAQYGPEWNSILPNQKSNESSLYYKHFHSELNDKIISLGSIFQAINALKTHDCKFIMTYMDNLLLDTTFHAPDNVKFLQHQIKKYLQNFNELNFLDWSKSNAFKISDKWHPLEEAHQAAAEYWLPKVRTLLNSSAKEEKPNASK